MQKFNLYIVEYLNSLPFLKGLELFQEFDVQLSINKAIPSQCASAFYDGLADIALLPIGALQEKNHFIFSDYCIGCDGDVQTVCVFSNKNSLEEIHSISYDEASRTSNLLLEILLCFYWKKNNIQLVAPNESADAKLIIGDAAFQETKQSKLVIDLGEEWKKFTGLPFVFAVWVSNQKLNSSYIQQFNQCFEKGISHISEITDNYKFLSKQIAFDYLTKNISYNFDERKKEALGLFQNYVKLLMPSTKLNSINA